MPYQRDRGAAELLDVVRENVDVLITDRAKEIVRFRVASGVKMGTKRGTGSNSFIDSVLRAVDDFYVEVVQHLKQWQVPPPKAPARPDSVADADTDAPLRPDTEGQIPVQFAHATDGAE